MYYVPNTEYPEDATKDIPVYENGSYDDLWIISFPVHAEEYRVQLEFLSTNLNLSEVSKKHHIASRLRNHAIYPENWAECTQCISESMEKEL